MVQPAQRALVERVRQAREVVVVERRGDTAPARARRRRRRRGARSPHARALRERVGERGDVVRSRGEHVAAHGPHGEHERQPGPRAPRLAEIVDARRAADLARDERVVADHQRGPAVRGGARARRRRPRTSAARRCSFSSSVASSALPVADCAVTAIDAPPSSAGGTGETQQHRAHRTVGARCTDRRTQLERVAVLEVVRGADRARRRARRRAARR